MSNTMYNSDAAEVRASCRILTNQVLGVLNMAIRDLIRKCANCGNQFSSRQRVQATCSPVCGGALRTRAAVATFWDRVDKSGECWTWSAWRFPATGYGRFLGRHAHRTAWELTNGPIPEGLVVMHKCDNPPCVNPSHLQVGTVGENNADRHAKGRTRSARGEARSHSKLTEAAVLDIRSSSLRLKDLASKYGVRVSAVCSARNGRNWKHVAVGLAN